MIKELISATDNYLVNFPNKEIELKRKIKDSVYELLLITYEANATMNINKKINLQERGIALIKFIDFLINQCYDKEIINAKRYLKFGENLEFIIKYFSGWITSTRKELGNKSNNQTFTQGTVVKARFS